MQRAETSEILVSLHYFIFLVTLHFKYFWYHQQIHASVILPYLENYFHQSQIVAPALSPEGPRF